MTMEYYVVENADYAKIKKLNMLHNEETFWDDVRRLTRNVRSDHSLRRWSILAEARFGEIQNVKRFLYED